MQNQFVGPLLAFAGSIFVAIVTSHVTVRLALRRFYAEKWWERKSAAYAAIIEALHHVRNHADTNLTFSMEQRELSDKDRNYLSQKLQQAMAELRLQLDVGDFVISDAAVAVMRKLMNELEGSTHADTWEQHLDIRLEAVNTCLTSMRLLARSDLRLH